MAYLRLVQIEGGKYEYSEGSNGVARFVCMRPRVSFASKPRAVCKNRHSVMRYTEAIRKYIYMRDFFVLYF